MTVLQWLCWGPKLLAHLFSQHLVYLRNGLFFQALRVRHTDAQAPNGGCRCAADGNSKAPLISSTSAEETSHSFSQPEKSSTLCRSCSSPDSAFLFSIDTLRHIFFVSTVWTIRIVADLICGGIALTAEVLFSCWFHRGVTISHEVFGHGWREVVDVIKPKNGGTGPPIIYTHGGGWIMNHKEVRPLRSNCICCR